MPFTSESRGQVEAETIDMHLLHPVAQTVHQELQHARVLRVEGVARAGVIHVIPLIIGDEPVVRRVIDAAETNRWPKLIPFRRVVVNHVQDHFEPGGVELLHHLP